MWLQSQENNLELQLQQFDDLFNHTQTLVRHLH